MGSVIQNSMMCPVFLLTITIEVMALIVSGHETAGLL